LEVILFVTIFKREWFIFSWELEKANIHVTNLTRPCDIIWLLMRLWKSIAIMIPIRFAATMRALILIPVVFLSIAWHYLPIVESHECMIW